MGATRPDDPALAPLPDEVGPAEEPVFGSGRQLAWRMAVGLPLLVGVSALIGHLSRGPLAAVGAVFVERFGLLGILFGVLLIDASPVPLVNEPLVYLGIAGGLPRVPLALAASAGALGAAWVCYLGGVAVGHTALFQRLMGPRRARVEAFVARYGFRGLTAAALTPIPFAICAWTAGAVRMHLPTFLAASLFRIVKTCFYLWLMLQGFELGR